MTTDTPTATEIGTEIGTDQPVAARAGRPRSEERGQAILDAALELITEVGYDRLSMDALADRAHASKATIYRHWSCKAEVVAAAVRCRFSDQAEEEVPDTGSLRGDLLAYLSQACDFMATGNGDLFAAVLWAMRTDTDLADLMRAEMVEGKQDLIQVIVDRAVARGECPAAADAAVAAEVMPAMVMSRMLITGEPLDESFCVHLVDDVMLPLLR
jgi:AcrR family transcriptional regulator